MSDKKIGGRLLTGRDANLRHIYVVVWSLSRQDALSRLEFGFSYACFLSAKFRTTVIL